MGYTVVIVIVGGALDETQVFEDESQEKEMEVYLARIKTEDFHGETCEVYTLRHDHNYADCECIQFVTDHAPYWSNNA